MPQFKTCPFCGTQNKAKSNYCSVCEADIPDIGPPAPVSSASALDQTADSNLDAGVPPQIQCPHCAATNDSFLDLCASCGSDLRPGAPSQPTADRPFLQTLDLVQGAAFGDFVLEQPLNVAAAHADFWVVKERNGGTQYVLKLFRQGSTFDPNVEDALKRLRDEHVVPIKDSGEMGGRHYQIQEYIHDGSLESLIAKGPVPEPLVKQIVIELTDAIDHLHSAGIIHCDVRPSNIYIRRLDPLDLVLADFGLSTVAQMSLASIAGGNTPIYHAPERLANIAAPSSDWWSVGILLVVLLTGKTPFHPIEDDQAIRWHIATRPVIVPENISGDWQLLIKGLLTRGQEERWRADQIRRWLDDERDIPTGYAIELQNHSFSRRRNASRRFNGTEYFEPSELAEALANNWEEGVKDFKRGNVSHWIQKDVQDYDLLNKLEDIRDNPQLSDNEKLCIALMLLSPEIPLLWNGNLVTSDYLISYPSEAIKVLGGQVPDKLAELRKDSWLCEVRSRRNELLAALHKRKLCSDAFPALNDDLVNKLSLSEPQGVIKLAREHRSLYVESTNAILQNLLTRSDLAFPEAVIFLACDQNLFLTPRQAADKKARAERESLLQSIQRYSSRINIERFDSLLARDRNEILKQASEYGKAYVSSTDPGIRKLLQQNNLSYPESLALLCCDSGILLTRRALYEQKLSATKPPIEQERQDLRTFGIGLTPAAAMFGLFFGGLIYHLGAVRENIDGFLTGYTALLAYFCVIVIAARMAYWCSLSDGKALRNSVVAVLLAFLAIAGIESALINEPQLHLALQWSLIFAGAACIASTFIRKTMWAGNISRLAKTLIAFPLFSFVLVAAQFIFIDHAPTAELKKTISSKMPAEKPPVTSTRRNKAPVQHPPRKPLNQPQAINHKPRAQSPVPRETVESLLLKIEASLGAGDYDAALSAAERAVKLYPDDARTHAGVQRVKDVQSLLR